ncbi:MAG: enoyl-CoA hydratase/isomerase family protein, partial [Spirochaetota bacterium]
MSGAEFRLLGLDNDSAGFLGLITLNDPKHNGNALDAELLRDLTEQLRNWQNMNIRAIVMRSSSKTAFSVGMDFDSFIRCDATEQDAASLYRVCLDSIYRFPAPVFCLLEKPARAGGVGLVMSADCVLATAEASLTLGEALFGLIPANVMP